VKYRIIRTFWQFAVFLQNAVFMGAPGLRSFVWNVREGVLWDDCKIMHSRLLSPHGGQACWTSAKWWFYRGLTMRSLEIY